MTDRPIIFSAPMVRALLSGRKTQTRRIMKPQPFIDSMGNFCSPSKDGQHTNWGQHTNGAPYLDNFIKQRVRFAVGDRLYVRENWQLHSLATDFATVVYAASINGAWTDAHQQISAHLAGRIKPRPFQEAWRPSIHMPRSFSRMTLLVTDVRVERLQEISEEDARAEGVSILSPADRDGMRHFGVEGADIDEPTGGRAFAALWRKINGAESWAANPWVAAASFAVHTCNIDSTLGANISSSKIE